MQKLISCLTLGILFAAGLHAAESKQALIVEMTDPKVRITVPGMHGIEMAVHPRNGDQPAFRLRGSEGTSVVSVVTPEIDNEVSPTSCATAVANVVLTQSVVTREQMFLGRTNEHTFLVIYGLPLEDSVQLNTHIISSEGSKQCVEVHVSKISTSDSDIEPWYNGFVDADISNL